MIKCIVYLYLVIAALLCTQIYDLLTQVNDSGLQKLYVERAEMNTTTPKTPQIPKIIHQTYKNASVPPQWVETRHTVLESNPDYEYKFWTDATGRAFLAEHYPWFLPTFDNYKYPIMRSDALRYFLLHHFGGFYIDLDIGVKQSLDPLCEFPTVFYKTEPVGVSNDFMASTPGHPFMAQVISSLQRYDRNWLLAYATVMYSTGPLFLSVILQKYNWLRSGVRDAAATTIYVLRADSDSAYRPLADFIFHMPGSSWHEGDASFVLWLGSHCWIVVGVAAALLVFWRLALTSEKSRADEKSRRKLYV